MLSQRLQTKETLNTGDKIQHSGNLVLKKKKDKTPLYSVPFFLQAFLIQNGLPLFFLPKKLDKQHLPWS